MLVIPAIDLLQGRAVRLRQGRRTDRTEYFHDPVEPALAFAEAGASYIHVIDLDGAFEGEGRNLDSVKRIVVALSGRVKIELGGGIRSLDRIARVLDLGVVRAILGTAAFIDRDLLSAALIRYGCEKIVVGIDARGGRVAIRGWEEETGEKAVEMAAELKLSGITRIVYTDIATDGMLSGPNLPALAEITSSGLAVIASGGISTLEEVRAVAALESRGVEGMIIGKAIYDGRLDLAQAIAAAGE